MAKLGVEENNVPNLDEIKKYRGLLGQVKDINDSVMKERARSQEKLRHQALASRAFQQEAQMIQKELSVQLRCAGRSYQQILEANHLLQERIVAEEEKRHEERTELEKQIRALKKELDGAAKPWKEEIGKRDLKIVKLQEAAGDQEERYRTSQAAQKVMKKEMEDQVVVWDDAKKTFIAEINVLREQKEEEVSVLEKALAEEKEKWKGKITKLEVTIEDERIKASGIAKPFEEKIKELETTIVGLQKQIDAIDYEPYEYRVKLKEAGYEKLVKDFKVKQQNNQESLSRMRIGFEEVIAKMDKKIQQYEKEGEAKILPWQELVSKREAEIAKLKQVIEDLRQNELEARKLEQEKEAELIRERDIIKDALEREANETYKLKRHVEKVEAEYLGDTGPKKRMMMLQLKLEEVTAECERLIKSKDTFLAEKNEIIGRLQKRVIEEAEARVKLDAEWNRRVQEKEIGYQKLVSELAYAHGQIEEWKEKLKIAEQNIRRRDRTIGQLMDEHTEELRIRVQTNETLKEKISRLEEECDTHTHQMYAIKHEWEIKYDAFRTKDIERVESLQIEIARRDKSIKAIEEKLDKEREEFEIARSAWEDKEREMDVTVRARDRQITALKNELELIFDSWQVKYQRLMGLFEKLQKRYDDLIGPGGSTEMLRRAKDLKLENQHLHAELLELKEVIKKQKRKIRDLELDYDSVLKETADIISDKEKGIADLVGDIAKLESRVAQEIERRERITAEYRAEKIVMVNQYQERVDQLEQLVESMRYTDRQELIDKIVVWRAAYERVCVDRDEVEEKYKELIDTKDMQLKKMTEQNSEIMDKVDQERKKGEAALVKLDSEWRMKEVKWMDRFEELEARIEEITKERDAALRQIGKVEALADSRLIDPEKDAMREKIKELEAIIPQLEAGTKLLIEENGALRTMNEELMLKAATQQKDWTPQIKWRDERYEAMVKEHDMLKEILATEMVKAQEACKVIEAQVRIFPNPFEGELQELRDKYTQSQAGLQKVSMDNVNIKEELERTKEAAAEEKEKLEAALKMAGSILAEVSTIGNLKMSKADIDALERAMGIDIDHDGKVGS